MFRGIRGRVVTTYVILTFLALAVGSVLLVGWVERYYVQNMEDILVRQARSYAGYYSDYIGEQVELSQNGQDLALAFAKEIPARVQVYTQHGQLVGDSTAAPPRPLPSLPGDVKVALDGNLAKETTGSGASRSLNVSVPLRTGERQVGALRLSSSLSEVDRTVKNIAGALAAITLGALALVSVVGSLLASTVISPVREITQVAAEIARGNLWVKAEKRYDDEIGRLAETINEMAHDLSKVERLRSEFISSVSHELRTPLTTIKGFVVTAIDGLPPENAELKGQLEVIDREVDRLTRLVEELLDVSRLQSGRLSFRPAPLDLAELLSETIRQFQGRSGRLGVDLSLTVADTLPAVTADRDRIKQVLFNLLDNALKFTHPGGRVAVTAAAEGDGVLVKVEDTGEGIAPSDLGKVTERFYRGRNSGSSKGVGLGLAITREIIELHRGLMEITSNPGCGTAVAFWLPGKKA